MALQLIDADERFETTDAELPGITDGDPETVYVLRPIGVDDHRRIVKANSADRLDRRTHQKVAETDWAAVNDDVLDFVLVGWRGILARGVPAECTRANKLRLDGSRRDALSNLAGMNQIQREPERRAESFREPETVPPVLG